MPARRREFYFPPWVERIDDTCLSEAVKEALIARDHALRSGATEHRGCRGVFKSAEKTLDQIEFARVMGSRACLKAATAVRKFTMAAECSAPSARR